MTKKAQAVLAELERLGDPQVKAVKARFAITAENSYGIFLKDLDALAKRLGKDNALALELFDSGVYEGQLLCSRLFDAGHVTPRLMEKWSRAFVNWEICDTFCMSLLGKTPFAYEKAFLWAERKPEFQKRAGFVLMVVVAFTDKYRSDADIRKFFPVMLRHATDERKYVMKGINWALRQVGKRNRGLYAEALAVAEEIEGLGMKGARWIGGDARRQLLSGKVHFKNYPKG